MEKRKKRDAEEEGEEEAAVIAMPQEQVFSRKARKQTSGDNCDFIIKLSVDLRLPAFLAPCLGL